MLGLKNTNVRFPDQEVDSFSSQILYDFFQKEIELKPDLRQIFLRSHEEWDIIFETSLMKIFKK